MTAVQLAQSNYRHEMCVFLVVRGASVMSGDAGAARRLLMDKGLNARHRDPDSGLIALQVSEAVQDVNDELLSQWDPALIRNEGILQAEID